MQPLHIQCPSVYAGEPSRLYYRIIPAHIVTDQLNYFIQKTTMLYQMPKMCTSVTFDNFWCKILAQNLILRKTVYCNRVELAKYQSDQWMPCTLGICVAILSSSAQIISDT